MQNKISQDKIDEIITHGFKTGYCYGEKINIARKIGVHRNTILRRWKRIENSF